MRSAFRWQNFFVMSGPNASIEAPLGFSWTPCALGRSPCSSGSDQRIYEGLKESNMSEVEYASGRKGSREEVL
eukprot:scaffold7381_cov310-Pinguiococcus_pyrenoidosus.AAC.36